VVTRAGEVLADRYRLIDEIGRGGMSVVWRAHDEVLDRLVAVKLLAPVDDIRLRARLRDEARAAGRLNHPRIAQVYDYGEAGAGRPYIAMEFVDGEPLSRRLDDPPMPWSTAVSVGAQVADALRAAHRRGLVHRDIKPDNVMITPDGVKLIDFGISAVVGDAEADDGLIGTPAYIAPERIIDAPVGVAADMYSLGVLLYRMLGGRLPWDADARTAFLTAHLATSPDPLPPIEGLPPEIAEFCMACLDKQPRRRPTSADAARILGAAAGGAPPLGPRTLPEARPSEPVAGASVHRLRDTRLMTRPLPVHGPPGRRRWLVAAAALFLVAALLTVWRPWTGDGSRPATTGARCQVGFAVTRDSGSEFTALLTMTDAGPSDLAGWQAGFDFPGTQVVRPAGRVTVTPRSGKAYDATIVQHGSAVLVRPVSAAILRAGMPVTVPIRAAYDGGNPLPTVFTVNGTTCRAQVTGVTSAPTPTPTGGDDNNGHGRDNGGGNGRGNGNGGHGNN
jgi:eukaryotic-like serine/threonine-protein kinase